MSLSRWARVVGVLLVLVVVAAACTPTTPDPGTSGLDSWKELRPAAIAMSDGRLAVFKVNNAGRLEYRVQAAAPSASLSYRYVDWIASQTVTTGPVLAGSPSAVLNADNTLSVVALGVDGVMYSSRQSSVDPAVPLSSFGAWSPLPVLGSGLSFAGSPTVLDADGDATRDVVVLGSDGNLWTSSQLASPAGAWAPWTKRSGSGQQLAGSIGAVRRVDNGKAENWMVATNGELKVTDSTWSGIFNNYGGSWANSPAGYLSGSANRLTVAGTNSAKELLVQQFLPTTTPTSVMSGANGSPAAARSGSTSYLFVIRDDGRVQFASVGDDGKPGTWHVIGQPPTPELVSPADGGQVYAPGEVALVANPVVGADEYRFELYRLTGGGRELVQNHTELSPTWVLPAGTLTAGTNYQWTARAWSNTTQLLSDYRTFGIVATNQTAAPALVAPAEGGIVDPYGTVNLAANSVLGADRYTFRVYAQPGGAQVWSTTTGVAVAPGKPVSVVMAPGTLSVGTRYQWDVDASAGGSSPSRSARGSFLATTGAASSSMMARTTTGKGYWLLHPNGTVSEFGDAKDGYQNEIINDGAVGIVARPRSVDDYWVVTSSGAIFTFNGAPYLGGANNSTGITGGNTAVGMAPTPSGNGYWILASDGAVFAFGDAQYRGGANGPGGITAPRTAVSITPTPRGDGYWILASDGAVFTFPTGNSSPAQYYGGANNPTGITGGDVAISLQSTPTGSGYWIASRSGGVFAFPPNAPASIGHWGAANNAQNLNGTPAEGFTSTPRGDGYWFMQGWSTNTNGGAVFTFPTGNSSPAQYFGGGNYTATPAQPYQPTNGAKFFPRAPNSVPILTVTGGTEANGRQYKFFLATDPSATTEIVQQSDWQSSTSWTPSPTVLRDGRTYFWRAYSKDFGIVNPPTLNSLVSSFRVDRRLGSSGPSPFEAVGPVSVNLASGNAITSWASPTVNGASVSLSYNSLAPLETTESGLPRGWSGSWSGDADAQSLLLAGGTVTVSMVDGSKENFTWKDGVTSANSWQPADESDSTLTEVSGSKWIYTTGDGTVHEFDAYGALTATYRPVDEKRASALRYTWADTPVGRRMTAVTDPVSGRVMRLYFAGDGQNGCPSAPPSGSSAAPFGYLCRVKLMDDRTFDAGYTVLASGLVQIGRIVGSDTSATSWNWEVANSPDLGGQYSRLVGVTDPLASDAIAAGLRTADVTTRTEIAYQTDGRVKSVTKPAPTTGAVRQVVSISYTAIGASVNRDGDTRPNGYSRQVDTDALGRQTLERDQAGRVTTTAWRGTLAGDTVQGDYVSYVDDPSGMRTSTVYDDQLKKVEQLGPAPVAWFQAPTAASGWASKPTAAQTSATPVTKTAYDEGLQGLALSFFATPDLTGGVKRRVHFAQSAFFTPGAAAPVPDFPVDNWSMRAEGLLMPPATGQYVFRTDSDGGIRVYFDDVKQIDRWDARDGENTTSMNYTPTLTAGRTVKVRIEFRDGGANGNWSLGWTPPGGGFAAIPASALRPNYGLVTSTTDADGHVARTSYTDAAAGLDPSDGLAVSTTQVVGGGQADLVATMAYEPDSATVGWRRQVKRTLPSGSASAVSYDYYSDAADPVANSCGVASGTNQAGRPRSTTAADPDGSGAQKAIRRWYVYDTAGRTRGLLTTAADVAESALGSQPWVCTAYDGRGRPTSVAYPAYGGAPARTVTTDYSNPLEVKVTDPAGTVTTTTDLLAQSIKYSDVWGTETTSTYDLAGRPTGSTMAGQATTLTYQPDGLLDTTSINGKVVADTTYAADGRLASVSYPAGATAAGNGTTGEFGYDTLARPSGVTWKAPGGALLASENVSRALSGNLLERWYDGNNLNGSNPDFVYDGAGRLTSAVVGSTTYTYGFGDAAACTAAPSAGRNSNRSSKTVAGVTTSYCYDAADRLVSSTDAGVGSVAYDTHGNTAAIFGETHTYDIADRHLSTTKGSTTVAYTRDATERIVERKVNGTAVARYLSSGGGDTPDGVVDVASGQTRFTWVLPGGVLFSTQPNAPTTGTWTYPNLQGSALASADQAGTKVGQTMTWDPDGNNITGGTPDNMPGSFDYGWLGQHQRPEEHQSGLSPMIEMGARQYSPFLGRFLEVDPDEAGSANDYDYAHADPLNGLDLDGSRCWTPKCALKNAVGHVKKAAKSAMKGSIKNLARVGRWTSKHRGLIATVAATAGCLVPAVGQIGCVALQAAAYGVRVQQRGYRNFKANAIDAGLTTLSAGVLGGTMSIGTQGMSYSGRLAVYGSTGGILDGTIMYGCRHDRDRACR